MPLSISDRLGALDLESDLDSNFYNILNTKPDWTAESKLHSSMYGEYTVKENKRWGANYSLLGIEDQEFEHEQTFEHLEEFERSGQKTSSRFYMAYDVWKPKNAK
ncbi:hypothetical protein LCGC14_1244110, partial [marine sediment metagenome]